MAQLGVCLALTLGFLRHVPARNTGVDSGNAGDQWLRFRGLADQQLGQRRLVQGVAAFQGLGDAPRLSFSPILRRCVGLGFGSYALGAGQPPGPDAGIGGLVGSRWITHRRFTGWYARKLRQWRRACAVGACPLGLDLRLGLRLAALDGGGIAKFLAHGVTIAQAQAA
jgi:hypothetical protein